MISLLFPQTRARRTVYYFLYGRRYYQTVPDAGFNCRCVAVPIRPHPPE